jgi:hypothetical protein
MRIEQLASAMDEAATTDIRIYKLWPILKQVLGKPADPRLQHAIALLDRWYADGGHRRDLTKSGVDQDNDAITLMDAWWPKLVDAEFHPALGDDAFGALRGMLDFGGPYPGATPAAPAFADGWYGYVSKDLRDLLARATAPRPRCHTVRRRVRSHGRVVVRRLRVCPRPKRTTARHTTARVARRATPRRTVRRPARPALPVGAYSRVYCGHGSLAACRTALENSLLAAMAVTPAQIYGTGDCASNPQASCYDQNRWVIASGVSVPSFPFQNRPTFQQVVELTRTLPR